MEEVLKELGDGSFLSSLGKVVSFFDIIWLLLGASTAYGTAKKRRASS
jgi:hypothetical protein